MTEAEQVMKRCQIGTRNYEEANNLHADCYRVIGKLLAEKSMREVQRLGQEIEQDHAYGYASRLAVAIWQKHYMKDAPKWKPLDTTEGVLTQIDNMTCGLVREKPAQPEQELVADDIASIIAARDMLDAQPVPPRTWVGLTDEQANEYNYLGPDMPWVVREVAAILKEQNT